MRLWSLHPARLDARGLVALWREGLLARRVLAGRTRGYRHHPQLERFRAHACPREALAAYLAAVCDEGKRRGYRFDRRRIGRTPPTPPAPIPVTDGQLRHERAHLEAKLRVRAPAALARARDPALPRAHPSFRVVRGGVAPWERGAALPAPRARNRVRPGAGPARAEPRSKGRR